MEKRDLYEVLELTREASNEDVKQSYRRLAREHHPDVNPDDPEAEERFKEISYANDVLGDEEKRGLYDQFGFDGLSPGFDADEARAYREWARRAQRTPFTDDSAQGVNLDELLSQLFTDRARGTGWPVRGADLQTELTIDFLDAVRGAEVRLQPGGGSPLRVQIPAGADDGTRIRLAGQGARPGPQGEPGDLYVTLRVRPHPCLRRDGDDLQLDLPVTLVELIRGADVAVSTPSGRVQLKLPPRSANGQRLRLRGKGVARAGSAAGDLLVRLVAKLPTGDDDRLDEIAGLLEPLYADEDVRRELTEQLRR